MNRRDNPYTPGAGLKPLCLAGRDAELAQFDLLLDRFDCGVHERSLIFSGLRGVGKTVLLLEFDIRARERDWATSDVYEVGSQSDFRVSFARMAARLLRSMSLRKRVRQRALEALGVVRAFAELAPVGVRLHLEVSSRKGVADSGDPEEDLADLLEEIGSVALDASTPALFLIDEMQNLDSSSISALCMAFHRMSKKGLPVALAGAGLPSLPLKLFAAKPYTDRLFTHKQLGRLSSEAAYRALIGPAEFRDVCFETEAAQGVVEESAGFPYFLQEYGRVVWDEAPRSPIALQDVDTIHTTVRDNLAETFFGPRLELATDNEQRYLIAMASLGNGPYLTSEVASACDVKAAQHVSPLRDALIRKELIWSPRRGQIAFTVPRFAEFIREQLTPAII